MGDFNAGENYGEKKQGRLTDNPFFTFSKPYLDFIGGGKFFGLIYIVMAIISLILPIAIIIMAANSGIFDYGGKYVAAFIFSWLVIAFACWIGFQLWLDRKSKVKAIAASEFIATPILSELLQTFGEWAGTLIGIIGAGVGVIGSMVLGEEVGYLFEAIGLGFMGFGVMAIAAGPLIGFFLIIISRFIAEQFRILAALANNTKEIAVNVKGRKANAANGGAAA
jgi:hypothetical protein